MTRLKDQKYSFDCPYCQFKVNMNTNIWCIKEKSDSFNYNPFSFRQKAFVGKGIWNRIKFHIKLMKMLEKQKRLLHCPQCEKEILLHTGKAYKINELSDDLINEGCCDKCGEKIDFRNARRISDDEMSSSYYCKKCAVKYYWSLFWVPLCIIGFFYLLMRVFL